MERGSRTYKVERTISTQKFPSFPLPFAASARMNVAMMAMLVKLARG
jgi:hypothetical protein